MTIDEAFRVLRLPQGSTFHSVRTEFRRLVKLYHPDLAKKSDKNTAKLLAIITAYQCIKKNIGIVQASIAASEAAVSAGDRASQSHAFFDPPLPSHMDPPGSGPQIYGNPVGNASASLNSLDDRIRKTGLTSLTLGLLALPMLFVCLIQSQVWLSSPLFGDPERRAELEKDRLARQKSDAESQPANGVTIEEYVEGSFCCALPCGIILAVIGLVLGLRVSGLPENPLCLAAVAICAVDILLAIAVLILAGFNG